MEIWKFIEKSLGCEIPTYIKNVMEVCGFDNAMTIAAIDEDDIGYFETEIKNGNISKHFESVEEALKGSNKSEEKDFQFVRGHKKFILKIRDLMKSCVSKNGSESFVVESDKSEETSQAPEKEAGEIRLSRKRKNLPEVAGAKSKVKIECPEFISEDEMMKHRNVIFTKFMTSLQSETPHMLKEVRIKNCSVGH